MSTYLLLRDNKQTGPYTLEEIQLKGFKPYDLIWVEGKSAGWRYPGELPEFAAIAPMVEEQPFDRFYKKKPAEPVLKETTVPKTLENASKPTTNNTQTIDLTQAGKSVYVAVPASGSTKIIVRPSRTEPISQTEPAKLVKMDADPVNKAAITNEPSKVASQNKTIPESESVLNHPAPHPKNGISAYSFALRAAVVLIILLSGIIIGLLLNDNEHSALNKNLQAKIERIKNKQAEASPVGKNYSSQQIEPVTADNGPIVEPTDKKEITEAAPTTSSKNLLRIKETSSVPNTKPETVIENKIAAPSQTASPKIEPAITYIDREKLLPLIQVEGKDYKVGVLGGISGLNLVVSNNSLYEIDALQIVIHYLGPENKVVKDQSVMITSIPAGQQKTIPIEKSNRGVKISYSIGKIEARSSSDVVSGS